MTNNAIIRIKYKKARQLISDNKVNEAKPILEKLYKTNRQNPEIALSLATIYRKEGNFYKARDIANAILKTNPKSANAYHILGSAQQCLNDYQSAIKSYKTAISLDNTQAETYYFLANLYKILGEFNPAIDAYRSAINLTPQFVEALNNLGALLTRIHQLKEAYEVLTKADSLRPYSEHILCNIGELFLADNKIQDAEVYANKALQINPYFFDAHRLLGNVYTKKGEYGNAIESFNTALSLDPDDTNIIGSIAGLLEKRGEFDEALNLLEPVISDDNPDPTVLLSFSAISRNNDRQKEAISLIETSINESYIDDIARINLYTELGKQYDSLENYTKSFENYTNANKIERRINSEFLNRRSDGLTEVDDISKLYKKYSHEFWHNYVKSGNTSNRPIFIVGLPRSGTTLTEQILASHPDVYGAGELPDIAQLANTLSFDASKKQFSGDIPDLSQDTLLAASKKYINKLESFSNTASRVVNKMPTDFWHIGLISLLFPNAYIINMIRDPRDICLSMYFQRFGSHMTFTTDLEELAEYYLSYKAIMQYWHKSLDIKILDVVYEDLVSEQELITRRIIDFCDLDWNDDCLNFHKTKRDVNTPSYDQVRKPMYKKSVARWKNYEEFLKPLLDKLDSNIDS